ncbi:MAG: hypothetical protein R3B96_22450 [Pirellulaceae bacterium]
MLKRLTALGLGLLLSTSGSWAIAQEPNGNEPILQVPATQSEDDPVAIAVAQEEEEAPAPEPELIRGELADGDPVSDQGELHDEIPITVEDEFRRLVIELNSSAFDTVLVLEKLDENGEPDFHHTWRNDDSENGSNSRLDIIVPEAGEYRIGVYSYSDFEMGGYQLRIVRTSSADLDERVLRNDMGSITAEDPINEQLGSNTDSFDIEIEEPSRISVDVWSEEFDTYLMVQGIRNGQPVPGQEWHNDDYGGSQQHSHIDADVPPGSYRITVAPYSAGEGGNYEMRATATDIPEGAGFTPGFDEEFGPWVGPDFPPFDMDPGFGADDLGNRIEVGILNRFDRQNAQGHYYDRYEIQAFRGQAIRISLNSQEFDTVLRVNMLDENDDADPAMGWENDDGGFEGGSLVEFVAPFDGVYRIVVTSFAGNAMGRYELRIQQAMPGAAGGIANVQVAPGERLEVGNLSNFDPLNDAGQHFDSYTMDVVEGETYTVDLNATGFDPILSVTSPDDPFFVVENDDYLGSTSRSLVEFVAPESGQMQIQVTSFEAGGEGVYQLVIRNGAFADHDHEHGPGDFLAPPQAAEPVEMEEEGTLEAGDSAEDDGRLYDEFPVSGVHGQQIRIDLASEDFDTYLILESPSGRLLEADDFQGSETRSVLEAVLDETGEFKVKVTSYDSGETGDYTLLIELSGNGESTRTDCWCRAHDSRSISARNHASILATWVIRTSSMGRKAIE